MSRKGKITTDKDMGRWSDTAELCLHEAIQVHGTDPVAIQRHLQNQNHVRDVEQVKRKLKQLGHEIHNKKKRKVCHCQLLINYLLLMVDNSPNRAAKIYG